MKFYSLCDAYVEWVRDLGPIYEGRSIIIERDRIGSLGYSMNYRILNLYDLKFAFDRYDIHNGRHSWMLDHFLPDPGDPLRAVAAGCIGSRYSEVFDPATPPPAFRDWERRRLADRLLLVEHNLCAMGLYVCGKIQCTRKKR